MHTIFVSMYALFNFPQTSNDENITVFRGLYDQKPQLLESNLEQIYTSHEIRNLFPIFPTHLPPTVRYSKPQKKMANNSILVYGVSIHLSTVQTHNCIT